MPTGVSHLYYPDQPASNPPLELDNSYFCIKIHDAQAFFSTIWPKQAKLLVFSSSVESSFLPSHPTQSLHKLTTLKKNVPCRLGVHTNLTDWLPARKTDTLKITLNYRVIQGKPIETLVNKMEQLQLEAAVSSIKPEMAVAIKVSQIVGHLLSQVLQEGEQTEIFSLTMDKNMVDLKTGYYAILGTQTNEMYPSILEMKNEYLTARGGHELSRYSYVVLQVLATPTRGRESIRNREWGELLQECKDEAINTIIHDEDDRDDVFQKWRISLEQVKRLALKDRSFLECEVKGVIDEAQLQVEQKLLPSTRQEAEGLKEYPEEWKKVLGVSTPQELRRVVRDYQDAVELSERLLQQYQQLSK